MSRERVHLAALMVVLIGIVGQSTLRVSETIGQRDDDKVTTGATQ
jgi:hypothetical protein